MDGVVINKPRDIAEAFSKHFHSVYSSSCHGTSSSVNQGAENLHFAPISNSDVQNAIKRQRQSKPVGLDGIPSFVIKGCPEILYLFLGLSLISAYLRILSLTCGSKQRLSLFSKKVKLPQLVIIGP
jgi:hypothetical protein